MRNIISKSVVLSVTLAASLVAQPVPPSRSRDGYRHHTVTSADEYIGHSDRWETSRTGASWGQSGNDARGPRRKQRLDGYHSNNVTASDNVRGSAGSQTGSSGNVGSGSTNNGDPGGK